MHHRWLLLVACLWVLIMLMVASKFIGLWMKTPEGYGIQQGSLTILPETEHFASSETRKWIGQPTAKHMNDESYVKQIHRERLELLQDMCQNESLGNLSHSAISKFVLDRIFVSDNHRILFCQTPKVGNTQWKKVLMVVNGAFPSIEEIPEHVVHDNEKNGLPRLSSFSASDIRERIATYFKFLIVRDPFERLISAYKDKFLYNPRSEPWYKHNIAPAIIRKYRKDRRQTRGGLQFEDFVRYLGDPSHRFLDLQFGEHIIHWVTYVELCAPCDINFDVIGHHETLKDDAPYILQEAGIDKYLATGQSLVSLHYAFMIGQSTASNIIRETCCALWDILHDVVMKKPNKEEWMAIADVFAKTCNFQFSISIIKNMFLLSCLRYPMQITASRT
uniref:Carbohydrate sulfotransferase n=1 Tax=Leptobrachium leishanense TaxID=445787 RepID=A0A8C5M830_9ANUR